MGLLDGILPLASPDSQLAVAAGLLGGRGNFGANLGAGLLGGLQAGQQERANRQNDLQQLQGLYKIALQNDQLKAMDDQDAGRVHVPDPTLGLLQGKMAQLAGLGTLSGSQNPGMAAPPPPMGAPQGPQAPGAPVPQGMPGMAPASASPIANPGYQPPQAQVQQRAQANAQQQQTAREAAMLALQRQGDRYAIMGMTPIAQERYKQLDPITTKYGVYFRDPNHPGQVILGGGMIPKDAMPVTIGPNGEQSIAPLPGQLKTAAQNAAAQSLGTAAGRFPFETMNVTTASGATVPALTSSVVGQPNIAGMPLLSSIFGGQGPQSPAGPQPSAPLQSGSQPPAPAPKVAQVTVTEPSKQAQAVPQDNADPWQTMPKRVIPQGLGQDSYNKRLSDLQADTAKELATKYGAGSVAAQDRKATNLQALDVVDRADTGLGASLMGDVKNLLISRFGIPAADFTDKLGEGDPNATATLNKDLMQAAVAKAKAAFGQRMSTNEVNNMMRRGAPNGDMMKGAIKFLLTLDNAKADYETGQANDLGRYLSNQGDPLQFEGWYSKTFPLSKALQGLTLAPNVGNSTAPATTGWKVERVQ